MPARNNSQNHHLSWKETQTDMHFMERVILFNNMAEIHCVTQRLDPCYQISDAY